MSYSNGYFIYNSAIWHEYLNSWDRRLRLINRRILLLVDNCPGHPKVEGLTHIRVEYLPKNTTSLIQPCDAGIIKVFKGHYRSLVTKRILRDMEQYPNFDAMTLCKGITILNAVHMTAQAWNFVTSQTIRNCFKKALGNEECKSKIDINLVINEVPIPPNMTPELFHEQINLPLEDDFIVNDSDENESEEDSGQKSVTSVRLKAANCVSVK